MAILATRRRWLVTSLCAASRSPCSRQLLASMYSCCGSNIGNRRISSRYRDRPPSAVIIGIAAERAIGSALHSSCPRTAGGQMPNLPHRAGLACCGAKDRGSDNTGQGWRKEVTFLSPLGDRKSQPKLLIYILLLEDAAVSSRC